MGVKDQALRGGILHTENAQNSHIAPDDILFPYLQTAKRCTPASVVISGSEEPNVRRYARWALYCGRSGLSNALTPCPVRSLVPGTDTTQLKVPHAETAPDPTIYPLVGRAA